VALARIETDALYGAIEVAVPEWLWSEYNPQSPLPKRTTAREDKHSSYRNAEASEWSFCRSQTAKVNPVRPGQPGRKADALS